MSTIKDVAKAAGVSPTTVSIILNGKSEDRKISKATYDNVMKAIQDLDYHPNLSARRLRFNDLKKPALAFFWPSDHRTPIMATFVNYIQQELTLHNYDCEFIIQTYKNDHLCEKAAAFAKNTYNAMIIGAASLKDVEFLESISSQTPIILINRNSERYSSVNVDDSAVGREAARLIYAKGCRRAALLASRMPYVATGIRTRAFLSSCQELGIEIADNAIIRCENTIAGGVEGAAAFCRLPDPPRVLFSESEQSAVGALYTFYKNNVHVPDDVELLSMSLMSPESTMYTIPPLSVIEIPQSEVSREIVNMLMKLLSGTIKGPLHKVLQPKVVLRESFTL
ncbi:MAG: LacI family transcriptional regulator [Acidaminococcus sp.]|jgi:LacI family purine nucleotide synthesis repressor|nr:LacI family transcriptional regulator [Acidaminococcus sp.]MCI2099618.1 LacI family transcriptional regulator [Acidaminococcus sp.]MCI2113703.1 LacI family transcriptional regulator [Acidaminococcus sp.]MCI2115786.1 LacI family transcriptional regulator [Acidaminococcus sp.]